MEEHGPTESRPREGPADRGGGLDPTDEDSA